MPAESARGVGALTRVEAILRNPETYRLADAIPPHIPGEGRPRDFPDFMVIVYEALISVYGSARQVEAEPRRAGLRHEEKPTPPQLEERAW